jgi:hypothetical protein
MSFLAHDALSRPLCCHWVSSSQITAERTGHECYERTAQGTPRCVPGSFGCPRDIDWLDTLGGCLRLACGTLRGLGRTRVAG